MRTLLSLSLLALAAGCGRDDDADYFADITEPVCWLETGQLYVQTFIPEGVEPDAGFEQACMNLGKPVEEADVPD